MRNLFLPNERNNFKARMITTPMLVILAIAAVAFNSGLLGLNISPVYAAINSNQLLSYHNQERQRAGLPLLSENKLLSTSALQKAMAMLEYDCWDHYCPNGKSPWEFFHAVGYQYLFAGENLAEGFAEIEDVMVAWMNSPTHKANILKGEYTEIGFGIVQGNFQGRANNTVIAVHFGSRQQQDNSNVTGNTGAESLPTPTFIDPKHGDHLNINDLFIVGSAPGADRVTLYNNTEVLAQLEVIDGLFSHTISGVPEQKFNLTAVSTRGELQSAASSLLSVNIDRSPDPINVDQLQVSAKDPDGQLTLTLVHPGLASVEIEIGSQKLQLMNTSGLDIWEAKLHQDILAAHRSMTISSIDLADNLWSGQLTTARLQTQAGLLPAEGSSEGGQVLAVQTKAHINSLFLIFLIVLFGIDFLVLALTGNTKKAARTHLHFALLLIIGIILLTGAVSGQIGQGLALN